MERYGVSADEAFEFLRRAAHESSDSLARVARRVVRARTGT